MRHPHILVASALLAWAVGCGDTATGDIEATDTPTAAAPAGREVPAGIDWAHSDAAAPYGATMGDSLRAAAQLPLPPAWMAGGWLSPPDLRAEASVCPGPVTLPGIDVSYYQGTIDWSQVATTKDFAVARVSDGTTFMDPQFANNWNGAKAAGVAIGAYQFFRPGQDATAQADIMVDQLRAMGFNRLDIPPVIDVEATDGQSASTVATKVNTWLARVQQRLKVTPMLYTSPGFWSSLGNPTPSPMPYLWLAHWTSNCPTVPPTWTTWTFWQYSSTGTAPGISGAVDQDTFNGAMVDIKRL